MIYKKVRISNMDENKKMYNYVPTLESLENSLPLVIALFLKPLNSKLLVKNFKYRLNKPTGSCIFLCLAPLLEKVFYFA